MHDRHSCDVASLGLLARIRAGNGRLVQYRVRCWKCATSAVPWTAMVAVTPSGHRQWSLRPVAFHAGAASQASRWELPHVIAATGTRMTAHGRPDS
jgi:hypothetical protein